MQSLHPYSLFHLGDAALTIEFGNEINEALNKKVLQLYNTLKQNAQPYILDLVPAYSSLAVYYDVMALKKNFPKQNAFDSMADLIEELAGNATKENRMAGKLLEVPVCYSEKFSLDMQLLCDEKKLDPQEVIKIHTSITYRVYMLGFLPGFCYMGSVDERIRMDRKQEPRMMVPAGSVGIAGEQTGIYPLESPGGWQIIGRTPLIIFEKDNEDPALFAAGDEVKFYSISEDEFENYQGGRI